MSARTKIMVLHVKEVLAAAVVLILAVILFVLVAMTFFPKESEAVEPIAETETGKYYPGVYTSTIALGDSTLEVQVCVDANHINSVGFVNLNETVETMYPLIEPSMKELSKQIVERQSTKELTFAKSSQYTSQVLLNAVEEAIKKASWDKSQ